MHRPRRQPTAADDELVTVIEATPHRGFAIPPPPPGFVPAPSGRFRTTGHFVGDSVPVDAPRTSVFDQIARETASRQARRRPLSDLDELCDLCIDGRVHAHPAL